MPANTTSLYSSSSSNITLSSNNLTTLYPGSSGTVTPQQPYGNANVVSLLAVSTDGANTIGNISATGNITGNYFIGNGSQLTGITGTYGNANVVTLLANFGSNTISTTGNVTTGNLLTGGQVSATGNVTGGNLRTGGAVSATGNVTGSYILGNGSQLTGLPATYSNANVVSLLAAFGSNTISTTGNITAGNVIAGAVSTPTVYSQGLATQGYDFVQMQYSNSVTLPVTPYDIGTGSWFYLDAGGGVFQSNTTGTLQTVVLGNDGSVSATGNITTDDQISATGNITTAGYFIGTFQGNISGNLTVPGSNTDVLFNSNGNAGASNNFTFDSSTNRLSVTGNVAAANVLLPNGAALWRVSATETELTANVVTDTTGVYLQNNGEAAVYGNTNVVLQAGSGGVNQDWTFAPSGNLTLPSNTAGINYANGTSILAGLGSTYGNANVSNFLANGFGSNTITTTGNITAGYFTGNGSLLTSLTGANVTGTVANAAYAANAGAATTAVTANTVTDAAQANITSVGTLTSLSVSGNTTTGNLLTGGLVSATGNITGNYFLGNGSQLTGLPIQPGTYGNANVSDFLANGFGSNAISTTGNVTAGYFVGNGSLLTSLTGANVTGTVANATYAANAGAATTATTANTVIDAAQANITSVGTLTSLSVSGNTTTGNLLTGGIVSATGNITGSYILGNGSQLTGLPAGYSNADVTTLLAAFGSNNISTTGNITAGYFTGNGSQLTGLPSDPPAGSNTQVQFNDNGLFGGSANLTFDKFTGNFTSGNIVTVGSTINSKNTVAYTPANTLLSLSNTRIIVGNGFDGNTAVNFDPLNTQRGAKLLVMDKQQFDYTANSLQPGSRQLVSYMYADLMGTTIPAASSTRLSAAAFAMNVGNGNSSSAAASALQAIQAAVLVGNANTAGSVGNMGNSTVNVAIAQGSFVNVYNGSTANTAIGSYSSLLVAQTGGTIGNSIGYSYNRADAANSLSTWNIGYFHPDGTAIFGSQMTGNARLATNYYAFYNKDNYADVQLGSLRSFHYFTSNVLGTGGSQAINKTSGPYQTTSGNLTANLDVTGFSGFVTSTTVTSGTNTGTKLASDVVTLLVPMGATPYSINMPTGNASIRYVGNISTVTGTANSMVQVQITGSNVGGTTQYLVNMENSGSNILTDGLISATGNITGGNVISLGRSQAVNFSETVTAFGNATGTITPNISLGAIQTMTLTGNITLNAITNIATGQSMTLILTQDATGGRTLTSSMLFAGGNKTLSTAAGAKDLVVLFYDGSTYYASLSKGYA